MALPNETAPDLAGLLDQVLEISEKTRLRVLASGEGGAWLERVLAHADEALTHEPSAERRAQAERVVAAARALAATLRKGEGQLLDVARLCKEFNRGE
jgi:hypothetical protein